MVNGDPNADAFSISMQFEAVNKIFEDMLINYDYLFKDIESEAATCDETFAYTDSGKTLKKTNKKSGNLLTLERKTWSDRYFILKDIALYKFKNPEDLEKKNRTRYAFSGISGVSVDSSLRKPFAFRITRTKKEDVILAAESEQSLNEWISAISECISA